MKFLKNLQERGGKNRKKNQKKKLKQQQKKIEEEQTQNQLNSDSITYSLLNTKIAEEETFSDIELDTNSKKNNNNNNHDNDDDPDLVRYAPIC